MSQTHGILQGLALALVALVSGCQRISPDPGVVRLLSFRQAGQAGVFLNETLVFHFDAELDRSSVTRSNFSIVREDGTLAKGRIDVQGSQVLFVPDVPLSSDFLDGGLVPGERYRVSIFGFPNPDGLRSRDGEPLARTEVLYFETVDVENESGPRFEDLSPDRSEPLQLESRELGPFDPIRLICAEPIDPATLFAEDFELYERDGSLDPIALRATLRSNGEAGALIELRPVDADGRLRSLPLSRLHLWTPPNTFRLRDLGGHLTLPVWQNESRLGYLVVSEPSTGQRVSSHTISFLDQERRSPEMVEDSVGTAFWSNGTVSIRFPAAAGNGSDGAVVLKGAEPRTDIHATDLVIPAGAGARLGGEGLIVLRSQGRLTIDGSLRRDVEGVQLAAEDRGIAEYSEWHRLADLQDEWSVPGMEFGQGQRLSDWLDRARELNHPWTVLIAGGELTVRGELWSDGPLLLVSGGWIRVIGEIRTRPLQFWTLGHLPSSRTTASPRSAPLIMDAPKFNQLASTQTWTVLSTPLRPPSGIRQWLPARVISQARSGSLQLSYIGERDLPSSVEVVGPVDSPVLLEDCEAIRLRIDLTAGPGEASGLWDPPLLDSVELAWEQELDQ